MIKAVIFDLDGTLLDRDASLKRFIDRQCDRLSAWLGHVPKEAFMTRFLELDSRGYVWKDRVYRQLIEEFDIRGITGEELLDDYTTHFSRSCVPFPNLIGMLERLRKRDLRLGIVTNGYTAMQSGSLKALGIEKYFSAILISEQEGIKKPDPQIFIAALNRLGVTAEESLYVGDHPLNDVEASQRVGMTGVWKKDLYWNVPVRADFVIEDLSELETVVKQLQG